MKAMKTGKQIAFLVLPHHYQSHSPVFSQNGPGGKASLHAKEATLRFHSLPPSLKCLGPLTYDSSTNELVLLSGLGRMAFGIVWLDNTTLDKYSCT